MKTAIVSLLLLVCGSVSAQEVPESFYTSVRAKVLDYCTYEDAGGSWINSRCEASVERLEYLKTSTIVRLTDEQRKFLMDRVEGLLNESADRPQ